MIYTDILLYFGALAVFLLSVSIMSRYLPTFPTMSTCASKLSDWLWASKCSFFSIAAWYCLVAPFAAAGFASSATLKYSGHVSGQSESFPSLNDGLQIELLVCLSSFVLGGASLLGMPKHGTKVILWKALVGIVASCIFGLSSFMTLFGEIGRQ
jgi:hypothetical protein